MFHLIIEVLDGLGVPPGGNSGEFLCRLALAAVAAYAPLLLRYATKLLDGAKARLLHCPHQSHQERRAEIVELMTLSRLGREIRGSLYQLRLSKAYRASCKLRSRYQFVA